MKKSLFTVFLSLVLAVVFIGNTDTVLPDNEVTITNVVDASDNFTMEEIVSFDKTTTIAEYEFISASPPLIIPLDGETTIKSTNTFDIVLPAKINMPDGTLAASTINYPDPVIPLFNEIFAKEPNTSYNYLC